MNRVIIPKKKRWKFLTAGLILYVIFLSMPILLSFLWPSIKTPFSWYEPSIIATVINGITAPLLSFIAIWVTFEAFWVQYESNTNQINISEQQRESNDLQIRDLKEERFENRFFNFINLLQEQERDAVVPFVGSSKQAYHFMFYEFKAICYQVINFGVYKDLENRRELELNQAFYLFLNGVSKSSISRLSDESAHVDKEEVKRMNEYLLAQQEYYIRCNKMPKYLKDYQNNGIKLFDGHRLYLVPFYRAFCMTLQYLYKACDESVVHDVMLYRNILLAQLSEHEIALLRIIYLYNKEQNIMFIDECYRDRVDNFFKNTLLKYIVSKTMNSDSNGFVDVS